MDENTSIKKAENNVVDGNSNQLSVTKEKDIDSNYFSSRLKKLVSAIYIVSNFIPLNDPLRTTTRELSVKLLSFAGNLVSDPSVPDRVSEVNTLCRKIVDMLEVAFFSGYVSEMNFSILKTEFDVFIGEFSSRTTSQELIDKDFLKIRSTQTKKILTQGTATKIKKADYTATNIVKSDKPSQSTKGVVEVKKTSRRESIISILRLKGNVGIKDISSVIINCSEKTIQRELTSLVSEGILKKTGDRRWSTYSLV